MSIKILGILLQTDFAFCKLSVVFLRNLRWLFKLKTNYPSGNWQEAFKISMITFLILISFCGIRRAKKKVLKKAGVLDIIMAFQDSKTIQPRLPKGQ